MKRPPSETEADDAAPPHLTVPEGTREEQQAWLRARIQDGLDSGRGVVADDEFFERIKRRGRERLKASRRAA
jgi:hypothetical protein